MRERGKENKKTKNLIFHLSLVAQLPLSFPYTYIYISLATAALTFKGFLFEGKEKDRKMA